MTNDHLASPSRLKIMGNHGQLEVMEAWSQQFAHALGLSQRTQFCLDLVLAEAVTNVMDYAGSQDTNTEIELVCVLNNGAIEIEISDNGLPFDPTQRAAAEMPQTLAEASPGGLGIHLMRRYTTHMDYRRENDRNILRMTLPAELKPAFN